MKTGTISSTMWRCGAAAGVVAMMLGCEHDPRPKQRPQGVPLSSIWAGTADGGAYFDCSAGGAANECTVWSDGTGETVAAGPFLLQDAHRAAYAYELEYQSFDGKNIHLKNNLTLVPTAKVAPPKK